MFAIDDPGPSGPSVCQIEADAKRRIDWVRVSLMLCPFDGVLTRPVGRPDFVASGVALE